MIIVHLCCDRGVGRLSFFASSHDHFLAILSASICLRISASVCFRGVIGAIVMHCFKIKSRRYESSSLSTINSLALIEFLPDACVQIRRNADSFSFQIISNSFFIHAFISLLVLIRKINHTCRNLLI